MKKILSILVCVCVLLSAMVFTASAADGVTISFAPDENRTSYSSSQQVWQENGIKVTNNKGASTNSLRDNLGDDHIRCYKSSEVIIEYPGMTGMFIDSVTYDNNDYASAWVNSFDTTLGTATVADGDVTIVFNSAVDSVTFATMAAQARAYSITVYTGGSTPTPPATDEDDKEDTTTSTATLVDSPVAGTAYKFGMDQTNVGQLLFANGEMSGYYMATVTDTASAVDVYLEEVSGGYNLYAMVGGAKKYLNMVVSGTYVNAVYGDTAESVFTYDATLKTVVTEINNSTYAFGTYSSYKTIGTSDVVEHPDNYFARFYTVGATGGDDVTPPAGGDEDDITGGETKPFDPTTATPAEIVDAAYALTGSETIENVTLTGKIVNVDYAYNAEQGNMTVTIAVEGADAEKTIQCYKMIGENIEDLTYDDVITVTGTIKNYNGTIEFDKPVCTAIVKAEVENNDPAADSVLTIKEAIELGASKKHNVYTENKYYVTGEIVEIYEETYGNMKLQDAEGNILTVYGTWSEDGSLKYGEMEIKPVVGDTVTVYGVIGQYKDSPQMKNGWFKDAPVVDGGNGDDTTGGDVNGGTTTGGTTTDKDDANTDNSTTSPATGDNVGAVVAMAVAAAAVLVASKKRA